jgi:hypothetical protein
VRAYRETVAGSSGPVTLLQTGSVVSPHLTSRIEREEEQQSSSVISGAGHSIGSTNDLELDDVGRFVVVH